ncbi:MAG: four helix bundle protein [Ignavibacterium sp.]|uniref:four helix bundle protein n=1 Tax=Ignavibacterium sp. TaxID=2651167 RepID=UPI0021DEB37A|nr:four helix bundle protein [Ignavibacterium sp.]BDQ02024.1 MAG: four helix bundle protein [Ignavibacterium sp.]GIV45244.1 MAG: four helix bundle protein [Ignavibacterium sp.]
MIVEMTEEFYKYNSDDDLWNEPEEFYNGNKDFTTLIAWQKCRDVKLFFYNKILPLLPSEERYNLDNQIRKASVSSTANIAEGYGRFHFQEGIQYYRISRASLYELKDHLFSCFDLNFIDTELKNEGEYLIEEAKKTLNGYINFVKSKVK